MMLQEIERQNRKHLSFECRLVCFRTISKLLSFSEFQFLCAKVEWNTCLAGLLRKLTEMMGAKSPA